jgi:hypothetical protein
VRKTAQRRAWRGEVSAMACARHDSRKSSRREAGSGWRRSCGDVGRLGHEGREEERWDEGEEGSAGMRDAAELGRGAGFEGGRG